MKQPKPFAYLFLCILTSCSEKPTTVTSVSSPPSTHTTGTEVRMHLVKGEDIAITDEVAEWNIKSPPPFYIAEHEVTQSQFETMLAINPSSSRNAKLPVDQITKEHAISFCTALTQRDRAAGILTETQQYRLPTLREWIIAASPGGQVPKVSFPNSHTKLIPAASTKANAYCLLGMTDNAAEWTLPDQSLTKQASNNLPPTQHVATAELTFNDSQAAKELLSAFPKLVAEMKSKRSLDHVIESQELLTKWKLSATEAAQRLTSSTNIARIDGKPREISVTYGSKDTKEAADLAVSMAEAFLKIRAEENIKSTRPIFDKISREIDQTPDLSDEEKLKLIEEKANLALELAMPERIAYLSSRPIANAFSLRTGWEVFQKPRVIFGTRFFDLGDRNPFTTKDQSGISFRFVLSQEDSS